MCYNPKDSKESSFAFFSVYKSIRFEHNKCVTITHVFDT